MGYDAALGAAQPMEIAATMRYLVPGINIVSSIGSIVCMGLIFPLGKKTLAEMHAELAARKAK
jgi:Na+/melibiose symporter-like transporter